MVNYENATAGTVKVGVRIGKVVAGEAGASPHPEGAMRCRGAYAGDFGKKSILQK